MAKIFSMKIINVLFGAILTCSLFSCTKNLSTTPPPSQGVATFEDDDSENYSATYLSKLDSVTVNIDANVGGYLAKKPFDYNTTTKKYPLLVTLHGMGELGNGSTDLYKVAHNQVCRLIRHSLWPNSFTVGGKSYSFIVVSPQFKQPPTSSNVNDVINYAIKKYRVDTSRIYLMGISMGGGATADYACTYGKKIAAAVPMAECQSPYSSGAKAIAASKLPVWAFHNQYDPKVSSSNTINLVKLINSFTPSIPAKKTIFNAQTHNCWLKATDPSYKENNMNIYQWMLQYKR